MSGVLAAPHVPMERRPGLGRAPTLLLPMVAGTVWERERREDLAS